MSKFNRILIANRGEIACRVIRTAQSLGYFTIAVYSDADINAPHVKMADNAINIGGSPVGESYLVIDHILQAAKQTGAEAIHPGYGFLSENAAFAKACETTGLVFIGPSAEAIEIMGNKAESRRRVLAATVPCVPGYDGKLQDDATMMAAAQEIDLPIMVKAAAGGGGRGMRLVHTYEELPNALQMARQESLSAFGSDELILEKAVVSPRHVEIQVFADQHGHCIHFGERDCSVQRRHQKVIEEAPCPIMTEALREAMGATAIQVAKSVNYCGAGTVEFLLDASGAFYFLEMNTRLQVEHPVTEMITGLDLVALQLQVSQGIPLGLKQQDIQLQGHAIEVRLYAEDSSMEFLPVSGPVAFWQPAIGEGVRIDSGIASGSEITPFYDPMVAKVVTWGESREIARLRMIKALKQTLLFGTHTNSEFLLHCLQKETFCRGLATTAFIGEEFTAEELQHGIPDFDFCAVAAIIAQHLEYQRLHARSLLVSANLKNWSSASALVSRRCYVFEDSATDFDMTIQVNSANSYVVSCGEQSAVVDLLEMNQHSAQLIVNGHRTEAGFYESAKGQLYVAINGVTAFCEDLIQLAGKADKVSDGSQIIAPMHGMILEVLVEQGERIEKGQTLLVVEAMKMHHQLIAENGGEIAEIFAEKGTQVAAEDVLININVD